MEYEYDGNNNSNRNRRKSASSRKLKPKRVTYDFEEIDRRSSSTFDADSLRRRSAEIHITVNKAADDEEEDPGHSLGGKTTIVSASDNHVSTKLVFNDEKGANADTTDAAQRRSSPKSFGAESNVSILIAELTFMLHHTMLRGSNHISVSLKR